MGTENNVKSLLDCHIIPALLQGMWESRFCTSERRIGVECFKYGLQR